MCWGDWCRHSDSYITGKHLPWPSSRSSAMWGVGCMADETEPASRKLRMRHGWTQSGLDCALSYCFLYSKAGFVWASLYRVWRSQTAHDSFYLRSLPCVCVYALERVCVKVNACSCVWVWTSMCHSVLLEVRGQPWVLGPQFLHCLWVFFSLPLHKAG